MNTFSRTVVVALVAMAALVGSLGVGIAPAAAHGVEANGCTGVPDSGYGFNFHSVCDRHDHCYRDKPYGIDSAGRKQCDRVFRSAMLDYCDRHRRWSSEDLSCRTVAQIYYGGVRVLGGPAWDSSGDARLG